MQLPGQLKSLDQLRAPALQVVEQNKAGDGTPPPGTFSHVRSFGSEKSRWISVALVVSLELQPCMCIMGELIYVVLI